MAARRPDLREEALKYFNHPVLSTFDVVRCIGYAEDNDDCYYIIRYPNNTHKHTVVWLSCVGGLMTLDRLKGQREIKNAGENRDETWDDFYRLDEWLALNGCPKEERFVEDYSSRDSDHD